MRRSLEKNDICRKNLLEIAKEESAENIDYIIEKSKKENALKNIMPQRKPVIKKKDAL